jgi:hypothetical protein
VPNVNPAFHAGAVSVVVESEAEVPTSGRDTTIAGTEPASSKGLIGPPGGGEGPSADVVARSAEGW